MSWHEGVRVVFEDARGRYVEALRDIESGGLLFASAPSQTRPSTYQPRLFHIAGEVLLSEKCAAAMVYRNTDPPCCSFCLRFLEKDPPEFRCDGCKLECYCSTACKDEARRSYHSSDGECAAFEAGIEAEAIGFEFGDVPERFLLRVLSQAGGWRTPGGPIVVGAGIDRVRMLQAHVPAPDTEERGRLAGISRNTLRLMDESVEDGVRVVDPSGDEPATTSRYGESGVDAAVVQRQLQRPHALRERSLISRAGWDRSVLTGVRLQPLVRSERRVLQRWNLPDGALAAASAAGEEITVSYVPTTMNLKERRRCLEGQYKFVCACARCVAEGVS